MRRTADAEDILGKHPVSPGALVPAREQLGDLLLKLDNRRKRSENLKRRLKFIRDDSEVCNGAAQAAEQAGDNEDAHRYYTKLAAQTSKAGGSRNELNHVREFLSVQAKAAESKGVASARE